MAGQAICLENLPLDVQLGIFDALAPYHLFKLSQTCKALNGVVSQREVWRSALKKTCERHSFFEPSFPMDLMTLDELRRSAMGPRRWYQKISRLARMQEALQPSNNRFIQEHDDDTTHAKVYIVPGGRYLLASTDYSITLWDLGSPYMQQYPPCILHTIRFKERITNVSSPIIFKSRLLRFTAQADMIGSKPFRLQVYEIGPLPENYHFRLVEELEIARHGYNFYVEAVELCDDDRIAFYFWSMVPKERRIVVWEFSKSRISSLNWYPTASSWSSKPSQLLVEDDTVTVLAADGVARWAVPPFQEMTKPFSFYEALKLQERDTAEPIFSIGFFEPKSEGDTPPEATTAMFGLGYVQDTSVLPPTGKEKLTFDVTWRAEVHGAESRVGVRRYRLVEPGNGGSPKLKILSTWEYLPTFHSKGFTARSSASVSTISPDVISTQKPVYRWDYESRYDFTVLVAAADDLPEQMEWQAVSLSQDCGPLKDAFISIFHSTPCLPSGRIAYLTRSNDHVYPDRFNEMYILDF